MGSYRAFAILVKDRYQAAKMKQACMEANIPAIVKTQELLSTTYAFEAFYEFFIALDDPKNLKKTNAVLAGPFFHFSIDEIKTNQMPIFFEYRKILEEKGLAVLCQTLFSDRLNKIALQPSEFYSDCISILEELLLWEQNEVFSLPKILDFFEKMQTLDPQDAPQRRNETETDAIQIMTMHASKGLEFEVVFAIGLAAKAPNLDEEVEAEKLRQLYVTMTRAKFRLYVPIPSDYEIHQNLDDSQTSPIELFFQILFQEKNVEEEIEKLSDQFSLTFEKIQAPIHLSKAERLKKDLPKITKIKIPPFQPSYFLSFTSISKQATPENLEKMDEPNGNYTLHNLPRGAETGIYIHKIFEILFSKRLWNCEKQILEVIESILFQTQLYEWKMPIFLMVQTVLNLPLSSGFSLSMFTSEPLKVETEFLFQDAPHFFRGFIDLLFVYDKKIYLIDWKTNWLGKDEGAYSDESMQRAIYSHNYHVQASIYAEAIRRLSLPFTFGGVYYFFIRGPRAIHVNIEDQAWKKLN